MPQSYIEALAFEVRSLRMMFCSMRSNMGAWSVRWRVVVVLQPSATARLVFLGQYEPRLKLSTIK